eukprot:CAMPEP_0172769402 /NCGR_PEP_ID=MMETSP1074-20121228/186584_1 /TAXON_ID=2916 /ORGANISM="Ceratium fusus, Strain PA161109" /LENGTH=37 /DNA_ID= /DNA_START= /DNA_END= /DNA_ORIENTATION=
MNTCGGTMPATMPMAPIKSNSQRRRRDLRNSGLDAMK